MIVFGGMAIGSMASLAVFLVAGAFLGSLVQMAIGLPQAVREKVLSNNNQ